MDEKSITQTIPEIDENLGSIVRRLSSINSNLHDGIFGESARDDEGDKNEMETPSLSSVAQRIQEINSEVAQTEEYILRIHESEPRVREHS